MAPRPVHLGLPADILAVNASFSVEAVAGRAWPGADGYASTLELK
jgi:hypothetical protein